MLSVPKGEPPKDYLDQALMAGVSNATALETWRYWQRTGLPNYGVEDLYGWLIHQAGKRGNRAPSGPRKPALHQPNCGLTGFEIFHQQAKEAK